MDQEFCDELGMRIREARERLELRGKLLADLAALRTEEDSARIRIRSHEVELGGGPPGKAPPVKKGLAFLVNQLLRAEDAETRREKRDEVGARLRLEAAVASLASMGRARRSLEDRLAGLGRPDVDLDRALEEKTRTLAAGGGPAAAALLGLAEEEGRAAFLITELQEALAAGRLASRELGLAHEALGKAARWGPLDLAGGGVLSSAIQQPHVETGRRALGRGLEALRRFRREVADLKKEGVPPLEIETGGRETLAEWVVDGLVSDIVSHSKVARARERVQEARRAVERMLEILGNHAGEAADRRAALRRRRVELLDP